MRIALIGPIYPYRGGIAHYTTMLYRALSAKHDVNLISFKRQYPQWLFPGRSDQDPSQKPLQVEGANYWIDSLNPLTWLLTVSRIFAYQPDLIILQWWVTFWAPAWCVIGIINYFWLRKPLIFICHNVLPHESHWWDSWLVKLTLRWGTYFIVQSSQEQVGLADLLPNAQIHIMPHPVYDMFAPQRLPREEARRHFGLSKEAIVLLFFGIVREYKNLRTILLALPKVQTVFNQVHLIIAGEFWENKKAYLELIEQLGLEKSVTVDDRYIPNEEVPLYFSAADILLAPYRQMTNSGVVQLARGFEVPVVSNSFAEQTASDIQPDAQLTTEIIRCLDQYLNKEETKPIQLERDSKQTWDTIIDLIENLMNDREKKEPLKGSW